MMSKQSSSRNQKVKGPSKFKLAFQICLLIAICVWLAYQAKQFGHQKAALVEESSKKEVVDHQEPNEYQILKLGRKNLNPRLDDLAADFQKPHDVEMEISEDEENKLRDNVEDESGVGNQEKTEEGADHEQLEDLIDEDDSED